MERCSTCSVKPPRPGQRLCRGCHAAYMREWRKTHRLAGDARRRANARSYANVYLGRGAITRQPCKCGSSESQMHHHDYSKPLEVEWMCRPCHLEAHSTSR